MTFLFFAFAVALFFLGVRVGNQPTTPFGTTPKEYATNQSREGGIVAKGLLLWALGIISLIPAVWFYFHP